MKRLGSVLGNGTADSPSPAVDPGPAPVHGDGDCTRCGGAGFVRVERPLDHPDFGRAVECGCEASRKAAAARARMRGLSNLGPMYGRRIAPEDAQALSGCAEACAFADELRAEHWMVLTGTSDEARVRLLAEMANRRLDAGRDALYFVAPDLLDRLRGAYSQDDGVAYTALFEHLREAPFLIVDDLDRTNPTPWAREKIWQLLSDRRQRGARTVLSLRSASSDGLELGRLLNAADGMLRVEAGDAGRTEAARYREVGGMTRDALARFSFGGFRIDAGAETNLGMMRLIVESWAERPSGWLTLLGGTGTGKTHLAAAAAGRRLAAGDSVYFAVAPDLFDALRETYGAGTAATYAERFAELSEADILVLDDLHAQARSDWVEEKLYQLLARRYVQRLPTLITSNLGRGELGRLNPRIASRLLDAQVGAVYEINAADYRTGYRAPERAEGASRGTGGRTRAGREALRRG